MYNKFHCSSTFHLSLKDALLQLLAIVKQFVFTFKESLKRKFLETERREQSEERVSKWWYVVPKYFLPPSPLLALWLTTCWEFCKKQRRFNITELTKQKEVPLFSNCLKLIDNFFSIKHADYTFLNLKILFQDWNTHHAMIFKNILITLSALLKDRYFVLCCEIWCFSRSFTKLNVCKRLISFQQEGIKICLIHLPTPNIWSTHTLLLLQLLLPFPSSF